MNDSTPTDPAHQNEPNETSLQMVREVLDRYTTGYHEKKDIIVMQISMSKAPFRCEFYCRGTLWIIIRLRFPAFVEDAFVEQASEFVTRNNSLNPQKLWDFDFANQDITLCHWFEIQGQDHLAYRFEQMCRTIFLTADAGFAPLVSLLSGFMSAEEASAKTEEAYGKAMDEMENPSDEQESDETFR